MLARSVKPKPQTVIFVLVVLAALGWWGYGTISKRRAEKAYEKQQTERRAQINDKVAAFCRRYDAITGWEEKFFKAKGNLFSLKLEDAIVNTGGKPILISGWIDDVARHGDKFFLSLRVYDLEPTISFVLECDPEVARRVQASKSAPPYYAIVARISSVEKAEFKLKSGVKKTEDEPSIETDLSDLFLAHGSCLDLLPTDDE